MCFLQLVRKSVFDCHAPMVQLLVDWLNGSLIHPPLRHPLRWCPFRKFYILWWLVEMLLNHFPHLGRIPSVPVDLRGMDNGDEILNSSSITWWNAEVRRQEDHRRWESGLYCALDRTYVGCVFRSDPNIAYMSAKPLTNLPPPPQHLDYCLRRRRLVQTECGKCVYGCYSRPGFSDYVHK